jgi:hypothetical protein
MGNACNKTPERGLCKDNIEWNNSSLRIPNSNKNMLLNLVYLQYNMDIIAINN